MRVIEPDWPAPRSVRAAQTLRGGGVSVAPFDSLNLGDHVGDDEPSVARNRRLLASALQLPSEPCWLNQVHGTSVAVEPIAGASPPEADAALSKTPGVVLAVLTADCLPLLLCDRDGGAVAAVHAGWRGLAAGVVERTVASLDSDPSRLLAWLGPAIGPRAFEVGDEVRAAFVAGDSGAREAFTAVRPGHWLADLHALARGRLAALGVTDVFGENTRCTYEDSADFFSYRRDGQCGRMASLVWIDAAATPGD